MEDMIKLLCESGMDFDLAIIIGENFEHAHEAPILRDKSNVETIQQKPDGEKCGGLRCQGCEHCACHGLE